MFDCVFHFIKKNAEEFENPNLKTIRFINNDEKTVEAFLDEFNKQFSL